MTEQKQDKDWVEEHFKQLQCANRVYPRWVLVSDEPMRFKLPRKEVRMYSRGGFSINDAADHETGILLYSMEDECYYGFFPGEKTKLLHCVNGHDFDNNKEERHDSFPHSEAKPGTCSIEETLHR